MCKQPYAQALDAKIFPGMQGGPLMHIIAAKAVALKEALSDDFKQYQAQIVKNARVLAETLLAENRPHEAVRCLEPALRSHAEDARVQYTTGLVWDAAGETARALSYYERAAKLQPDNELYSVVYRRALSAANSPSRAGEVVPTSYLQSAPPEARPAPADLVLQPASVLAEFGSRQPDGASNADHSNASVSAGKIAAKPEDPQVPISAAVLALQSGQPQLAVELLEPAVKQFPNSAPLYRALGTAYYRRGDYPSSQRALQQALSLDKSSALSYFLMGCTLAKIGQETAAENHFRQAELLDSRYAERRVGAVGSPPAFAR